jgi:hypothetical protein
MTDILNEAYGLMDAAEMDRLKPTEWRVGMYASRELRRSFSLGSSVLEMRGPGGFSFLGIDIVPDVDLPEKRIELRAGDQVVGVINV